MSLGDWPSRIVAFLLLAMLACGTAQARGDMSLTVNPRACVTRVAPGESFARVSADRARFDCDGQQNRLGTGNFITRLDFEPMRAADGDPLVLRTTSVWQDAETLHFRYADGSEERLHFTQGEAARYLTTGAIMEFPVPQREAPLSAIFIETEGSANLRGVVQGAQLMPLSNAYDLHLRLVALYSAFAGLVVALLVYNFALWMALGARFQLYYCSMVAALGAYTFTSSGALMVLLPHIANNDRLRINYALLTLTGVTGLRFVAHFFGMTVCGPRLTAWLRGSSIAGLTAALAFAVLAPWQIAVLDRIYFLTMTLLLAMVVPLLVQAWRARDRFFWLFLFSWSAPIIVSALRAAHGFNLIPYSFLLDNGNMVALFVEALFSALMVTARLRELSRERDHARKGELTARRLAGTDPLTGLLNRRAFLDMAIGRRARQRLLLIDIDHFKLVNDRLGHDSGDQVLQIIAEIIDRVRPERSLAVRLGGEEFALLLSRAAAERCTPDMLLDAVRQAAMPQGLSVTVSIGYSEGQVSSEEDWKRLYRLADAALYRAKADGRDRACKATDFRAAA